MIKKEMFLPAWILILMIVFTVLCMLVWLSRGRMPFAIKQKMRVGAMILALTASASGCVWHTCYVRVAPVNVISFKEGEVNLWKASEKSESEMAVANKNSSLKGRLFAMRGDGFSYIVTDAHGKELRKENLALSEASPKDERAFEIDLKNIDKGTYELSFYRATRDSIGPENLLRRFKLKISN
jgi:hypothetical protein